MRLSLVVTLVAAALSVALALALSFALIKNSSSPQPSSTFVIKEPFRLVAQDGSVFTERELQGRPHAVFFGFTNCPDVCPTTLLDLSEHLKELGSDGDKLRVVFIAVDAERDTREQVGLYLQSFDPRIVGLTGTKEEIDAAVKAFKAYYKMVPEKDGTGYSVAHTALVYLFDRRGRFAGTLDQHEARENRTAKLRRLVKSN